MIPCASPRLWRVTEACLMLAPKRPLPATSTAPPMPTLIDHQPQHQHLGDRSARGAGPYQAAGRCGSALHNRTFGARYISSEAAAAVAAHPVMQACADHIAAHGRARCGAARLLRRPGAARAAPVHRHAGHRTRRGLDM